MVVTRTMSRSRRLIFATTTTTAAALALLTSCSSVWAQNVTPTPVQDMAWTRAGRDLIIHGGAVILNGVTQFLSSQTFCPRPLDLLASLCGALARTLRRHRVSIFVRSQLSQQQHRLHIQICRAVELYRYRIRCCEGYLEHAPDIDRQPRRLRFRTQARLESTLEVGVYTWHDKYE